MNIPAAPGPWIDRWADLPLIGGKVELPVHDGDIAQLHELRDRIYAAAALGARIGNLPGPHPIYAQTVNRVDAMALIAWPADHAAKLLAAWRAITDTRGVAA